MTITLTDVLEYEAQLSADTHKILSLIKPFFTEHYGKAGDDRAELWLEMPNPLLGGLRPIDMIKQGRTAKLKKFIETCLRENER